MPLNVPQIDNRSYREILDEALARVPVHNPEWTNFNDSDPGVTLLQLFAFMTDSLLYRANLMPERNRRKFLQLLGIPLRPAAPAAGVIAVHNERGPADTVTLPASLPVLAGAVGFVTENALDVLPVEARVFTRSPLPAGSDRDRAERLYAQLYGADGDDDAAELDFYRTTEFEPPAAGTRPTSIGPADSVDGSLWLALLVREADGSGDAARTQAAARIAGRTLTLGLVPSWDVLQQVLPPGRARRGTAPSLSFQVSTGMLVNGEPRYDRLPARSDGDPLETLALVQLTLPGEGGFGAWRDLDPVEDGVGDLPPALEDETLAERVICWIRIRGDDAPGARFSWVGINAARVTQRVRVPALRVGTGTGEPDQAVSLASTPVLPDSVSLTVDGEPWQRTDDVLTAPPESGAGSTGAARVFEVDREAGTLRFGNGHAGARPRAGSTIVASYAWGGGRAGNVGIGGINRAPQLPAGVKAWNPVPTWGGDDGETVAEAERRIPLHLRHRDRAVTADDFRAIVRETPGVDLGRVEVLSTWHPAARSPAPGVVTVMVVPDDVRRSAGPVPDRLFLQAVCRHLDPRRLVTTEIVVRGPDYVPLSLAVGIEVVPGLEIAPVREAVLAALRRFLSPLQGGQEEGGWPLDRSVEDRELWARAARVAGVASVRGVRLFDGAGVEVSSIAMSGLQLPRLDRISVRAGDPEDMSTDVLPEGTPTPRRVPVPVVPASC